MSDFTIFTKKLRIEKNEKLKDMASKLKVTSSYLSAVEVGKRRIPFEWIYLLSNSYNLSSSEIDTLKKAYLQSCTEIKLDLSDATDKQKYLALKITEKLQTLDSDALKKILTILNKE